ncbi:CYTH domain-containing protein [Paenibacillus chartarius]|uniref:CYTH domain-containing protein n=1 Tax=Paenibacillus chartarius TaxID=747481 RepID=A0ABV6DM22_9BACL
MSQEIERKYLLGLPAAEVLALPGVTVQATEYIYQTYLAYTNEQEIRIRKKVGRQGKERYTHTFKAGQGMAREEIEYEISGEIYEQLLQRTGVIPLEKIRTTLTDGSGRSYEIDEYKQVELAVVEVEFASLEEAQAFAPPAWFGRELGAEEEFRNKTLWLKLQSQS